MSKSTMASMLSYEERKVMHEIARGKQSISKAEVVAAQRGRHEIKRGLSGKDVDNFLKTNTAKAPIKVKEKRKAEKVDKTEEM